MKVSGDWLTNPATQAVCACLTGAGYQALFVGGCVRNALIRVAVTDIDISTDALPQKVTDLAEKAGFKVVPTGVEHGTVTVIAGGIPHEITTFRRDVQTDGRHAVVAFSTDIAEDARRRDLTMNALYCTPDGSVVDPLGGLPDLMTRQVRFVGDANARIIEDYLRILRFFRFYAIYGNPAAGIDAEGLAACAAHANGLPKISRERIGAEMRKLLSAPDPAPAVASMAQAGVLAQVIAGADPRALGPLIHLEGDAAPHWLRRLVVLGGERLTDALKLSRAETTLLGDIRDNIGTTRGAAELGYRHGADTARDIVLARAAMLELPLPPDWQTDIRSGADAAFPILANDLMPDLQGPALGAKLKALETRWIESGFVLSRAELLA